MPSSSSRTGFVLVALTLLAALPAVAQETERDTVAEQTPTARAQDAPIQVNRAVVATGVQEREPIGVAETFDPTVGHVFFYTVFEGDFPDTDVAHVWLHEGSEVARVPLTVRGPRWRTWSSKEIASDWTGAWEVRAVDASGEVLESTTFTIGEAAAD